MKKLLLLLLCTNLISIPSFALDGGWTSGGGDTKSIDNGAAWFYGNEEVSYCVEVADHFVIPKSKVLNDIEKAITKWQDYMKKRQVDDHLQEHRKINNNFSYKGSCQKFQTELSFFIGSSNSRVSAAKTKYYNPTAFAEKESFDYETRRGKGFIWLRDSIFQADSGQSYDMSWDLSGLELETPHNPFFAIILHEIGHVLGNGHVEGTIMRKDIVNNLLFPKWYFDDQKIDHYHQLISSYGVGDRDTFVGIPDSSYKFSKEIFKTLTGRDANGKIEAKIVVYDYNNNNNNNGVLLVYRDSLGEFKFPLTIDPTTFNSRQIQDSIFKRVEKMPHESFIRESHDSSYVINAFGSLTATNGQKYLLNIEFGTIHVPRAIKILNETYEIDSEGYKAAMKKLNLNVSEKYANVPIQLSIFDGLKRKRVFGPSAYWLYSDYKKQ